MTCAEWILAATVLSGCSTEPTLLLVDVQGPTKPAIASLSARVAITGSGQGIETPLPAAGGPPSIPGSFALELPDVSESITVSLTAVDEAGNQLLASGVAQSRPHQRVALALTLGVAAVDGGADLPPNDLTADALPDAADAGVLPCPGFALFCDDFESGAKWSPGPTANNGGSEVIDTAEAFSATHALDVTAPATASDGGVKENYLAEKFGAPFLTGTLAIRTYVYLPKPLTDGTGFLWWDSPSHVGSFLVNIENNGGANFDQALAVTVFTANGNTQKGNTLFSTSRLPIGRWFCLELVIALAQNGRVDAYLDGAPALTQSTDTIGTPFAGIDRLAIGLPTLPVGGAQQIFFDDVAVATQRIGCEQ